VWIWGSFPGRLTFSGRIRSLKDRALEQYLATEEARRSAEILIVSSVVTAYLSSPPIGKTSSWGKPPLRRQQSAYDLIKRRYDVGLAN